MTADSRVIFSTELDSSGLKNGLNKLKGGVSGLAVGVGSALGNLGAKLLSNVVTTVANSFQSWIDAASDLNEVQNVVDTTFGKGAEKVNEWAKAAKEAYGMSELKAKQYASTMGAMLKSTGLTENATLSMSEALSGLAGDMASFYNLDYDEAFEKIRSGISGETEPLKQLGINMSVANLEAYALSQGITTSYDKMGQAAQATLRYNYIMSATADAQGDFAKTSDGYANQQRILATTQEELAATIGQLLLPASIKWTKALNGMVTGLKSAVTWVGNLLNPPKSELDQEISDAKASVEAFDASIQAAGNHLDVSLESAKATKATADSLLSNYETIISKNVLTEEDTAQLRAVASEIVALYPDMAKYIDETTGQFNTNTTAIKDNIKALSDDQMATAYYTATQEYRTALLDAAVTQQKAQKAYDDAYADWIRKNDAVKAATGLYDSLVGNYDAAGQFAGQLFALDDRFHDFLTRTDEGTYVLSDYAKSVDYASEMDELLSAALVNLTCDADKASGSAVGLCVDLDTANEALTTGQENLAAATEACNQYGDALIYTANTNDGLSDSQEKTADSTKTESDALAELKQTLKDLATETLKTVESQVNGFEKMGRVGKQSAKSTISALKSQQKYMADYSTNLQKAKDKGVSEKVIASLSDGTTESAKILAGLAVANQKQVDQINELYTKTEQQKTELAASLAVEQAKIDEANKKLGNTSKDTSATVTDNADKTVTRIEKRGRAAKTAADGVSSAASVAKIAEQGLWKSKASATTAAQQMVSGVKQTLADGESDLTNAGATVADNVASGIEGNEQAAKAAGMSIMAGVVSGVRADNALAAYVRSKVSSATASASGTGYSGGRSIGYNIMAGINAGLTGALAGLNSTMRAIVNSLLATARRAAGVKSPSTLFRDELGNYLAEGIGVGFSGTMESKVLPSIVRSIGDTAAAGQAVLDNTLLAKVQRITGLQLPSVGSMTNAIMRGSAIASAAGVTNNSNVSTVNYTQNVTFESTMQAPDEIARTLRRQATYGLAGAKA